jgi:hypothetical protein
MTWYTVSCGKMNMGLLLYGLFFMVKYLWYVMMGLGSNGCFVTCTHCLNWGHGYGFAWMGVQGTSVVLQVPRDNVNPVGKGLISWVNHLELNYDTTLIISIYYIYMAYIIILFNEMTLQILQCMWRATNECGEQLVNPVGIC